MDNKFLPGERVLLSGEDILERYNNRMCTFVAYLDGGLCEHTIDGYGERTFHSYSRHLHRTDERLVDIEETDLMEVLACD